MKVFFHRKDIFRDIQSISLFWFNGIWMLSLIPLLTKHIWQGPEVLLTFFLSLTSIGIGLGSILCYRFQGKFSTDQWSKRTLIAMIFMFIALGFFSTSFEKYTSLLQWIQVPVHMLIIILFLGFSFLMGLYVIPLYTRLQLDAPLKLRSKAIANNNIYNAFYMTLSTVIFIVLVGFLPIHAFFWVLAGLNSVFLLFFLRTKSS